MQGKVSIVIPCFNKVKYIGAMLDSVIAQKWDNIEVILVNDGSTDGTQSIIAKYELLIRERGYEIVIIDQENKGACAAVKAGMECISGIYICIVDADDELDPEYVSTMAQWLDEYEEYDYCSCDYLTLSYSEGEKIKNVFQPHLWPEKTYTPEFFLCNDFCKAVWAFMTRKSYIDKCRLIETFYTDTRGSYEPSFFIPFTVYGGKMKHFCLPLYYYSIDVGGLSQGKVLDKRINYCREYHRVIVLMLNRMPASVLNIYKKKYLIALSSLYTLKQSLLFSICADEKDYITEALSRELLAFANNFINITPPLTYDEICKYPQAVCRAVELSLSGMWDHVPFPTTNLIGYGVLGKAAAKILPMLYGTIFQPKELWDSAGDGLKIKKPNFSSLNEKDTILMFPTTPSIIRDVYLKTENTGARFACNRDIYNLIAHARFPQLGKC